jgi:hypothetical protein
MISSINGRRELGKSTLALYLARQKTTRVIFDPRFQFRTSPAILKNVEIESMLELLDTQVEIIVHPESDVLGNFQRACDAIKIWLQENPDEPFCFLVDEARFVDTPSEINESLDWILRCTPRKLVDTIFTSHRPADIAVNIRAIADYWYIFRITQQNDLKVIEERCGPEVRDMLPVLKVNELIVWNDSVGTARHDTDRSKWYVSMSAPIQTKETVNR